MLFFALFLAGFMLGVFVALYVFKPEKQEEAWDPQHFPIIVSKWKPSLNKHNKSLPISSTLSSSMPLSKYNL